MRKPIITSFCLIVFCLFSACEKREIEEKKLPNIVFIMADDLGYGDLGSYNADSKIPTPNIDTLAARGMMFLDAHSPDAWCTPSRYGLMTGTYPARTKMDWRDRSIIGNNQETLATLLKRNGYNTAIVGKWHLGFDNFNWENPRNIQILAGGPTQKGFDYFFGMHASLDIPPYFFIENGQVVEKATAVVEDNYSEEATSTISGAFWRGGAAAPSFKHNQVLDKFESKAVEYIEEQSKSESPFFLYFPLTAPHTPWLPKEDFIGKSEAGEYGDFVVQVDQLVGNILATLKRKKITENTLVIFTSDNGPVWFERDIEKFDHDSKLGLKGMKIDRWEGGSRVPFIVSWSGHVPKGIQSNQLLCFTDMMATFAYLVGDTTFDKNAYDSYNLLPAMLNENFIEPIRKELLVGNKVYRQGDLKLIEGSGLGGLSKSFDPDSIYLSEEDNQGELYDLSTDVYEENNLYLSRPELVNQLRLGKKELSIDK